MSNQIQSWQGNQNHPQNTLQLQSDYLKFKKMYNIKCLSILTELLGKKNQILTANSTSSGLCTRFYGKNQSTKFVNSILDWCTFVTI